MNELFPHFLRAIISDTANVFIMGIILQPRYSRKITIFTMLCILGIDFGVASYCYLSGNLTMLSRISYIIFAVLCFVVRPLFKDTFLQWLFSYLTVQNIFYAVVLLSFLGTHYLPYPLYTNSMLRFLMFTGIIYVLVRYVRPLYHQTVKHWMTYFTVALGTYVAFGYYIFTAKDIVVMLATEKIPLLLITFISLAGYCSIFLSINSLKDEYELKEENQKIQSDRAILKLTAGAMEERLQLMSEIVTQNSHAAHDRRHFNNTLLELLEQDKKNEAIALLKKHNKYTIKHSKNYCENPVINASVCYYAQQAEQAGILTEIQLDIKSDISIDSLELSMVISNLLENAIYGCERLDPNREKYIYFSCKNMGRLLLTIENPCLDDLALDKDGYPISNNVNHGIGSKSVVAFAKQHNSELLYLVKNGVFQVRMLV